MKTVWTYVSNCAEMKEIREVQTVVDLVLKGINVSLDHDTPSKIMGNWL